MKYIQVLAYGPGFSAEPTFVGDDLETMRQIVGGDVEIFDYALDGEVYQIAIREDAEALGLPRNRKLGDRVIHGHLVVTRGALDQAGHWKFKGLPARPLEKIWKHIDETNRA